jgi:predicted RecA/RadA family phage recombinase
MSTTYLQPGDVMDFTAPAGGVTKGVLVLIGGLPVIPTDTVAAGSVFRGKAAGVHSLPKTAGETWTQEQPVFWDATGLKVSNDPTVGQLPIGSAGAAAAAGDANATVRLNGVSLSGRVINVRKRVAIAVVNAGATLVPAIPGAKYRLVDAFAIAIGGAVTPSRRSTSSARSPRFPASSSRSRRPA